MKTMKNITKHIIYMAAALMVPYCLGSCSSSENADNIIDEKVPLEMGTITVSGSIDSRAYDATAGDGYTRWQWKPGEEITIQSATSTDNDADIKECIYVLSSDGTTWNIKAGETPIYMQDVDEGNHIFNIYACFGGLDKGQDIDATISIDQYGQYIFADQSTARMYQLADYLRGSATLGTDRNNATTFGKISANLLHQNIDVVVNLKRGIGWGANDTEATEAFKTHINGVAAPMIYAGGGDVYKGTSSIAAGYRIKPLISASADGNTYSLRVHLPIYTMSHGDVVIKEVGNIKYLDGAVTDAPILQLTTTSGTKLNATFSLTAEQAKQVTQGSRLTINLVYDNYGVLHTQSVVIGKWNDGGTTNIDGEYSGTLD
jgi:hypothetical protein